jgi:hypothetical protein
MNRSVLLVICDFLIVTLISFVRFESTGPLSAGEPGPLEPREISAPAMSNMVATLEAALEAERARRELLTNALAAKTAELDERMRLLAEREARLSDVQERLGQSEMEARRLAEEREKLEQARREAMASVQALHKAFEVTQKSTDSLQDKLTDTTREAAEAKARLQALEEELRRRQAEAEKMQEQLAKLDSAREALSEEKQQLLVELRTTEVEALHARSQVTNLNQQLTVATREKASLIDTASKLATNVGVLSQQSTAIREQIARQAEEAGAIKEQVARQTEQATAMREQIERQTRLPANTIYGMFLSNKVDMAMTATTGGAFGQEVVRRRQAATVLVRMGDGSVRAVSHVDSMPLKIWPPDAPWTGFGLELSRSGMNASPQQFALATVDPRVALIPVSQAEVDALGVRVFEPATDAAEYAEAVIIGAEESYYGESTYRLSPNNPGHVEMQRSSFRRLFGEFAPRRGDLAFTKSGHFLGVLVNSDHCLLVRDLDTLPAFRTGQGLDAASNSSILRAAQATLERLPYRLR